MKRTMCEACGTVNEFDLTLDPFAEHILVDEATGKTVLVEHSADYMIQCIGCGSRIDPFTSPTLTELNVGGQTTLDEWGA